MDHALIQDMPTPAYARLNPPRDDLSDREVLECRMWARRHYQPGQPINRFWHPAVIEECIRMNEQAA